MSTDFDARAAEALSILNGDDIAPDVKESVAVAKETAVDSEVKAEGEPQVGQSQGQDQATAKPTDNEKPPSYVERAVQRIAEREQAVAKREKELAEWKKEARTDLNKFLKDRLGLEPDKTARALMAKALGDAAPPEYQRIKEQFEARAEQLNEFEQMRAELEELKSTLGQKNQEVQYQTVIQDTQREISQYVTGDLKALPMVASAAKANAEYVQKRVFEKIVQDAQAKIASGRLDAEPMTPAEAARLLEEDLSLVAKLVAQNTSSNAGESAPAKAKLTASQSQQSAVVNSNLTGLEAHEARAAAALAELFK